MVPKPRADKGTCRKIEPETVNEAIQLALPAFHGGPPSVAALYRACIERGLLSPNQVACTTFRRIVKDHQLLKSSDEATSKRRLAFAKPHANDMWQADTMVGPYVTAPNGTKVQARLIAFVDDASRVCCHGQFFLAENTDSLIAAMRSALYKRGVPDALYVDNGSIYTSKEIVQICARLGTLLCHAPVRDGAAKGKVERFFRTVRMSFLTRALELSSVAALNDAFSSWVEDRYNASVHRVLKMRPIDRFGLDLNRIRFMPPNDVNDELFFVEHDRHVGKDNTFSLSNVRFEAPRDLRSRKIQVRFRRKRRAPPSAEKSSGVANVNAVPDLGRVVAYYKGERMGEARPVDFVANDRPKARPVSLRGGAQ